MANSISAFNSPYQSRVELPQAPWDLIGKVMETKQNKYDQSFQALQSFKNTALNIQFLNQERQGQVNQLNKELDTKFNSLNGEYGDLSDSKTYNNYVAWFDGLKKNTDLIQAYNEDKKWQSELSKIGSLKQSKDPTKAGYSSVNEYVFNHKLKNYIASTKDNKVDFQGYTPYKDIVGETTKIYKSLPKKEWTETVPDPQRPGYMKTIKMSGYNKDDLYNVINSMGGDMQEQFRIEAEYSQLRGLTTNPTQYKENLYNSYVNLYQDRKNYLQNKLNETKQKEAMANEDEKPQFAQLKSQLEQNLNSLSSDIKSKDWFLNTSEDNLLGIASQLHTEKKIGGLAQGLSNRPSIEYKPDMAYYSAIKLKQSGQQFNANLQYKASQDAVQNQFRSKDLELKAEGLNIQREKLANDLAISNNKVKKDKDGNVVQDNLFGNVPSGNVSVSNPLEDAHQESLQAIEDDIRVKAFNVADGKDYKVPFNGRNQSNDELLESIISLYDDNNIGKSTNKIREYLNKNNLASNISINTLVESLPLLADEFGSLDIKNKVGLAKTRLNQILNGDTKSLKPSYSPLLRYSNDYNQEVQKQDRFLNNKANYYNEAVRDMPEKDWNKMTETQQSIVSKKINNLYMSNNKLPSFGLRHESFADLGDSPNKEQMKSFEWQGQVAKKIKESVKVDFDIPQQIIASVDIAPDGNTVVYFKGENEFKKYIGEEWKTVIGDDPWIGGYESKVKGIKGSMMPNSYMVIKTAPISKPNSIDEIIANGDYYQEFVNVDGQSKKLKIEKNQNNYVIRLDGKTILVEYPVSASPSQVLEAVKKEIQK